jgi:hypothetical protein
MYSQAQIDAMNRSGLALLKSQKNKTYKPPTLVPASSVETKPYTVPSGSAGSTGQISGLPYLYTPSADTASGSKSGTGGSSTNWSNKGSDPTIIEQPSPSYLGNGTSDTGAGASTSSTSNEYGNVLGVINDYGSDQKALMLNNLRAAFDQSENEYNAQKPLIQQEAAGMRNKADTGYYQSLPELYRAMEMGGQRGGENITGMVGLNTIRQEGQNQANLYEANQLRNIENAILGIGTQRAQAEAEGTMGINADVFSAKLSALKDAMAQTTENRNIAKADFNNTIGAFSDNYQAEINRLTQLMASGQTVDTDNVPIAYKISALNAARNQKKADMAAADAEAAQTAEQNALAWARINKSGASSDKLSYDEAFDMYLKGDRSPAVLKALGMQ